MKHIDEKQFKRIKNAGVSNIVIGTLMIVTGITLGTLTIIEGGKLLSSKRHLREFL